MNELSTRVLAAALTIPGSFTAESVSKALKPAPVKAELRFALWQLHKEGLLSVYTTMAGERIHLLAPETRTKVAVRVLGVPKPDGQKAYVPDHTGALHDIAMDLVTLAHIVGEQPAPVAKKGYVNKKTAEEWSSAMLLNDKVAAWLIRSKRMETNGSPVALLMLDLALRIGLVVARAGSWSTNSERLVAWLDLPDAEQRRLIWQLWLDLYPSQDPFARLFAMILFELEQERWIAISAIQEWMNRYENISGALVFSAVSFMDELNRWRELGWIEIGLSVDGQRAIRFIAGDHGKSAPTNAPLYIQPDFEILIPSGSYYRDHYILRSLCELVNRDRLYTYRITPKSFAKACENGWTAEHMIEYYASASASGIPAHVELAVRQWERQRGKISIEPVYLIRMGNAEIAGKLFILEEVRDILTDDRRWTEFEYVLPQEAHGRLLDFMRQYGITDWLHHPRNVQDGDHPVAVSVASRDRSNTKEEQSSWTYIHDGLLHQASRTDLYEPVKPELQAEALYSGLKEVPVSWWRESRHYHTSTLRTIMEQAIDWGCYLIVRIDENVERKVAPIAICRTEGGGWTVTCVGSDGQFAIRYDQIQSIRISLPGVMSTS